MRSLLAMAIAAIMASGVFGVAQAEHAAHARKAPATTAAEVIERNVAARGGLEAWRKVDTMVWMGHLERGGLKGGIQVPFVMEMQRPNRSRFEIKERYDQFTRIFDGTHGWKVRPGSNGQPDVKSFSKEEVDFSRDDFAIDGPLIDYQAKGVKADLDGIDLLDGRKAYRLSLKLQSGVPRKVWIDVETNLEVRYDRPSTSPLAPGVPISVYYGGFETVNGLKIPKSIVTGSSPVANPVRPASTGHEGGDALVIDKVLVNPKLDDQAFLPPPMPMRRGGKVLIPSDGSPVGTPGQPR